MLLHPATQTLSAAKIGLFGRPGSGKTLTAIMILIALSKRESGKPIAMLDTEGGSDFVKEICDLENVPLLVAKGRSFVEMRETLREAEAECCGLLVDSYSEPWKELNEALREKLNLRGRRMQYQHRDELYLAWGEWVRDMLASPLHVVLSGRLSNEWEDAVDDSGDVEHLKIGTKMRGETDAGYEPHLLIEMDAVRESLARDKKTRSTRGSMLHNLLVLKDRFRVLNGRSFQFRDINIYKSGMYETTAKALAPHLAKLAARGPALVDGQNPPRTSAGLFHAPPGESSLTERTRRVTIAIEEIQGALTAVWSGSTNEEKRFKAIILETIFQTRSWTKIETFLPERLESAVAMMKLFEDAARDPENSIRDEASVIALIANCRDTQVASERASLENAVM